MMPGTNRHKIGASLFARGFLLGCPQHQMIGENKKW